MTPVLSKRLARGLLPALFILVLASAIGVTLAAQQKRQRLNELDQQTKIHDAAQAEWNRLRLEQATLSAPRRIEQLAAQLHLHIPESGQMREMAR